MRPSFATVRRKRNQQDMHCSLAGFREYTLHVLDPLLDPLLHYNYCRKHGTLKMTPAMAAGMSGELWDVDRLMKEIGV